MTNQQKEEYLKLNYQSLNEILELRLVEYFQSAFSTLDQHLLFNIFRDVSLQVIDKLWVAHIDEMQYLKDKVGFMGYAQLDPLIVYKKESFEKFQDLLTTIKVDTSTFLMRLDFMTIAQQQQAQLQIIEAVEKNPDLLAKLKSASQNVRVSAQPGQIYSADGIVPLGGDDKRKLLFSDEDGVEIFEVDGEKADPLPSSEPSENLLPSSKRKIRPNDPCPCGSGKKYKKCCGKEE